MTSAKIIHIPEPKLAFGYGQEMEHPKDGLFLFGPTSDIAKPAEMRFGVIGPKSCIASFNEWTKRIRSFIPSADTDVAHHASWPGFEAVFGTKWPERGLVEIEIDGAQLAEAIRIENRHEAIFKAVSLFEDQILRHLRQSEVHPTLWFVVIPDEIHRYGRPKSIVPQSERRGSKMPFTKRTARKLMQEPSLFAEDNDVADIYRYDLNFHHQLKARLLDRQLVLQIVRDTTLTPECFIVDGKLLRATQDPATVAWNLCTTAFFKASGKPWRLASVREGVCYVGLVFKKDETAPESGNACCGAQMFLDSGDGVVFRGAVGPWYSKVGGDFHLSREKAAELMQLVVNAYTEIHGKPPSELFIHGKTRFDNAEWEGFSSVVPQETNLVGVRIRSTTDLKLYRHGKKPVLRGTALCLTPYRGFLWSKGFVPRLNTYPGWETPNPLSIEISRGKADLEQVMTDILGLTKVNFNACVFADGVPVTLKFADAVGEILTAAPVSDLPPLPFRHYI